jgi:integrase
LPSRFRAAAQTHFASRSRRATLRRQLLELRFALGLGKPSDDALLFRNSTAPPQSPRAHASRLIDAGIDVVKISRRLGHGSPAITLTVYAHQFRKRDDKSSAAINAAVASLFSA